MGAKAANGFVEGVDPPAIAAKGFVVYFENPDDLISVLTGARGTTGLRILKQDREECV